MLQHNAANSQGTLYNNQGAPHVLQTDYTNCVDHKPAQDRMTAEAHNTQHKTSTR